MKKYLAEMIGTMWLVLGGCGSAIFACGLEDVGIGYFGVAAAFGLTVVTMAYAIGHISGCHLNPAISIGLCAGGRFNSKEVLPYIIAQVIGAIIAAAVLYVVVINKADYTGDIGSFATNGYGEGSPSGYSITAALLMEILLTAIFLFVIMGSTSKKAAAGFAPLAIGLTLTLIHLVSIPITNTSVNPARSTGVAFFTGGLPLSQLWLFWVAPIIGGALGALAYNFINGRETEEAV